MIPLFLLLLMLSAGDHVTGFLALPGSISASGCQFEDCTNSIGQIDCDNLNFTCIPTYGNIIAQNSSVLSIHLASNMIDNLPADAFVTWKQAGASRVHVYLSDNGLTSIDDYAFRGMESTITELYLEKNELNALPEALGLLEHLERLIIFDNPLTHLPFGVMRLIGLTLTHFVFTYDHFTTWPQEMKYLRQIEVLIINSGDNVTVPVPNDAFHLDAFRVNKDDVIGALSYLYIDNVDQLPVAVCTLHDLSSLSLNINTMDASIPNCKPATELTSLSITGNYSHFPDLLLVFRSLTSFHFYNNSHLTFIPDNKVPDVCNITHMFLDHNSLRRVPTGIQKCSHLVDLNLRYNSIEIIERGDLENLAFLENIVLAGNPLQYIATDALTNLPSVRVIDLKDTMIQLISSLSHLSSLGEIYPPDTLDCSCDNLAWLEVPQHRTIRGLEHSVCLQNTTQSVDVYIQTSLGGC